MTNLASQPIRLKKQIHPGQYQGAVLHENKTFLVWQGMLKPVRAAREFLKAHESDKPFKDKGGKVKALAEKIEKRAEKKLKELQDSGDNSLALEDLIFDEVIAVLGIHHMEDTEHKTLMGVHKLDDDRMFLENPYMVPPVEPPTAGSILSQQEHRNQGIEAADGTETICVMEKAEAYIVAVAVLRELGFDASLAELIDRPGKREKRPEMRVLALAITDDNAEVPLATMSLEEPAPDMLALHPPTTHVELISDEGAYAITLALKMEAQARQILCKVEQYHIEGEDKGLAPDESDKQIKLLGDMLVEINDAWPMTRWILYKLGEFHSRIYGFVESMATPEQGSTMPLILEAARQQAAARTKLIVDRVEEIGEEHTDDRTLALAKELRKELHELDLDAEDVNKQRLFEAQMRLAEAAAAVEAQARGYQ